MGVDHLNRDLEAREMMRMLRQIAVQTIQNAAIGHAGIRVYDAGQILFEGGGGVEIRDSGYIIIDGDLTGAGEFNWSGPMTFTGTVNSTGNTAWAGLMSIVGNLTVTPSGSITVGPLTLDRGGAYGGRVYSSGTLLLDAATNVVSGAAFQSLSTISALGDITSAGDISAVGHIGATSMDIGPGAKNFRIEHPTKPGYWLRHGSTESPVSGTEYTGRETIGPDGSVVVVLPDYFEALNKPEGRTVQLTPVGRPFQVGAGEVVDGKFTAYGEPGRDVFWLVKAERFSGEFPLEERIPTVE